MPKRVVELTPIPVSGHGFPVVTSYQVVGEQLYAFPEPDLGIIVIFNQSGAQAEVSANVAGTSIPSGMEYNSEIQFALHLRFLCRRRMALRLPTVVHDLIAVLDPAKLTSGKERRIYYNSCFILSALAIDGQPIAAHQAERLRWVHHGGYHSGSSAVPTH